jgi:ABC-type Fe3+ transport system permease subunit
MRENLSEFTVWLLLGIGVLSPLSVFPITRSRMALASFFFCLSISCLVWIVVRFVRGRRAVSCSEPWQENSPEIEKWLRVRTWLYGLAVVFLGISICFMRPWQGIVSAPGYMFFCWGAAVNDYIRARRPPREARPNPLQQPMAPIRSDHWGERL